MALKPASKPASNEADYCVLMQTHDELGHISLLRLSGVYLCIGASQHHLFARNYFIVHHKNGADRCLHRSARQILDQGFIKKRHITQLMHFAFNKAS